MKSFRYHNTEKHGHRGQTVVRKVFIKGGKGYKSVTRKRNGRNRTIKRALKSHEIHKICRRKFIPGLFDDCK